jgi:uncharacterized protein (DUF2147 family)
MKIVRLLIIVFSFLLGANLAIAQNDSIIGSWKTIDDESGEPKSIVSIYKKGNQYFGKIDSLFRKAGEDPDPVCDKCPEDDSRYNQKILNMEILKNLAKDGDEYVDGTILDPKNGKVYDCKLWVEDGHLKVRGYLLFLYRTQTWYRVQ